MTWSTVTSTGRGTGIGYALVIEGWPDVWITHSDLSTYVSSYLNDGRTARVGLLYQGLEIRERFIPHDAMPQVDGMTFSIRSADPDDDAMASFTTRATGLAKVSATSSAFDHDDTSITLLSALPSDGIYHIATEAIDFAVDSGTTYTVTRGQWGTEGQSHKQTYFDKESAVWVYDRPASIEGRRCWLVAFADGDSPSSGGTEIWRGVVTRPAQLGRDGITWSVRADSVVAVLDQTVVGFDVEPAKVVGLYHHRKAPVILYMNHEQSDTYSFITGWHATPELLAQAIDDELESMATSLSVGSEITSITFEYKRYASGVNTWRLTIQVGATAPSFFSIAIASPLIGGTPEQWLWVSTSSKLDSDELVATNIYSKTLETPAEIAISQNLWMDPRREIASGLNGPDFYASMRNAIETLSTSSEAVSTTYPENRIYIDQDYSGIVGQGLVIETNAPGSATWGGESTETDTYEITAASRDATNNQYYVEVNTGAFFDRFLGPESRIRPIPIYTSDYTSSMIDFISGLQDEAKAQSNDGVTPYIQAGDFASLAFEGTVAGEHMQRAYRFYEPVSLRDVLAAELHAIGHMMYLDANGRIAIRALPITTTVSTSTQTVDTTTIVTPGDPQGAWETYELSAEGLVNTIIIHEGYDPIEDEWMTTHVVRDADSISNHKSRGRGELELMLYSVTREPMSSESAVEIGLRLFSLMAQDYATVTVRVPFSCFGYLCGSIVLLTSPRVPDGSGGRGVTGRACIVVGRRWPLDPARSATGELTLWMMLDPPSGYAPSAAITAQSNVTGNQWTITCGSANTENVIWSQSGDGKVLKHWSASDRVRVMQRDSTTPFTRSGTVNSVDTDNDQITVTLDGAWTPGSSSWILEAVDEDDASIADGQRQYAYVAETTGLLDDGSQARRLV